MSEPEVAAFLDQIAPPRRQAESRRLDAMFRGLTGWAPQLWRGGMLGYGQYDYTYASGRSGSCMATGFAPRVAGLSVYIMPGYADFGEILGRLRKHRKGRSCLTINTLEDIDLVVLEELVRAGLDDLAMRWPVRAT